MKKIFTIGLSCIGLLFANTLSAQEAYKNYPMWNSSLSFETRVNDLVSRLTLEEKVAQMLNAAPAVPRLGIAAYDWWNEVLHGVARTPYKVTVFPQAIGMAATWDTAALHTMADYAALEGRAIHNKAIAEGKTNERYLGLTYWTPNINIFRDPRWGRGQETYGEDPYLTAMLGRAFVNGLQGDDPKYLKAAACAKHFAVHSGPEPSRHADNFDPSLYDLWDTYLPAFKELVINAKVAGVMCAYNAVNTQPCCANSLLMTDILRKQWKFTGYVTSDCWAIDDFFRFHKTHANATESAVDALIHGTDVECGRSVYSTLTDAVKKGLLTEKQLDVSLRRLFLIRYRLGMFDPVSMVKYAQTPASVLESPAHQAHALKMARESIVLLKNDDHTLPLSKNIKKIVVLGPNANNPIAVLGNYNGIPSQVVTALKGIEDKLGTHAEIVYEKAINFTDDTLLSYINKSSFFSWEGKQGFNAAYFNNKELKGNPVKIVNEPIPDHFWQEGENLMNGMRAENFSARFSSNYISDKDEALNFEIDADDGYRFYINDVEVINAWEKNRWGAKVYTLHAKKDSVYKLVLEYWQGEGKGNVKLSTGQYGQFDYSKLEGLTQNADAIVFIGGISPQLEGEEMKVNLPGFNGGDRTSILLPTIQTALLQKLKATGKPVVFVMMTGSAIATPWESENIPAIVNAWYGGQSAGTAIADVLFDDYNPSGRLPVTFYKSDNDIPGFSNYSMYGRTYRYFKGDALYPFGYGLSYTQFNYDMLQLPAVVKKGQPLKTSVKVSNVGKTSGDEVVQLYISFSDNKLKSPLRALKGFQRINLAPGESRTVQFSISADQLSLVNEDGKTYQPQGEVIVSIGGTQPQTKNKSTSGIVSKTLKIIP